MEPTLEVHPSNDTSRIETELDASGAQEMRRGFSEPAKQNMLAMIREMTAQDVSKNGYYNAQPSFETMTALHEQKRSGLIDDEEVVEAVQALADKLKQRKDQRSIQLLDFVEDHFIVMDVPTASA